MNRKGDFKIHTWGGLLWAIIIVIMGLWAVAPGVQASESYSYLYKGKAVYLTPSKGFVALGDDSSASQTLAASPTLQLERDSLSEQPGLKKRSFSLYRISASQQKGGLSVALAPTVRSYASSVGREFQPVFEQGNAILVPSAEIIVGFKSPTTLQEASSYLEAYRTTQGIIGVRVHRKDSFIVTINTPFNGRALDVSRFLAGLDKVAFAEPNFTVVISDSSSSKRPQIAAKMGSIVISNPGASLAARQESPVPAPVGWTTIASFNLESSTFPPAGWALGNFQGYASATWGRTAYRKHNGSYSMHCARSGAAAVTPPAPVPCNMGAVLRSPAVNLSAYAEVYVELWFYAINEQSSSAYYNGLFYDYPEVVVFNDTDINGADLICAASADMTTDPTTQSGWRKLLYRVPPALRTANAYFELRYFSDDSVQTEGAYIDDIRIAGTSNVDTQSLGNDTYGARQYELMNSGQIASLGNDSNDMHVPEAWDLVPVSPNIVVAVIDCGVDLTHPDLNLVTGYDGNGAVGGGAREAHGTSCAGNVGAKRNNSMGVMGTAPGVKVMPVYFGETIADLASAIDVAVTRGAKVLSNSWGLSYSADIESAVLDALAAGRVAVFAAGNGPDRPPFTYNVVFPGSMTTTSSVICVGASSLTDEYKGAASSDGNFWWGSSYVGASPDVCAPGTWSYTTDIQGSDGYNDGSEIGDSNYTATFGGTSSSTPKLAGIVALILSANPSLTPAAVKSILRSTADQIDPPGPNNRTGAGRVNAVKAVQAALALMPPSITSFSPNSGAVSTGVTIVGTSLGGATSVKFNGTAAQISSNSATQIVVTVPAGATTGQISVVTAGGTATSASSFQVIPSYALTVTGNPANYGSVTANPLPGVGGRYGAGTVVTLTANPNANFRFTSWSGGAAGSDNPVQVTLNSDTSVTANFEQTTYTLDVSASPGEGGNVTGGGTFQAGSYHTVTAVPNSGYRFINWTENGNPVTTSLSLAFALSGPRSLVANFAQITYSITASASPSGGGTISGAGTYPAGSLQTLTATPQAGFRFVHWMESGRIVSTSPSYAFTLSKNRVLVGTFARIYYKISLSALPAVGGTVSGTGSFAAATQRTVKATPKAGYRFVNWTQTGQIVGITPSYTFTLNGNCTLVANFARITYTLAVTASPVACGAVVGGGTFPSGTLHTVKATPIAGYRFVRWTENGAVVSTAASYAISVTRNRNLVANFVQITYSLSVSASPLAGGSVSGGGIYPSGSQQTVTATANSGYHFVRWTNSGTAVSTAASYAFTLNKKGSSSKIGGLRPEMKNGPHVSHTRTDRNCWLSAAWL